MYHSGRVGGCKRIGNLPGHGNEFLRRKPTRRNATAQSTPRNIFENNEELAAEIDQFIDCGNPGMGKRRRSSRFLIETPAPHGIARSFRREELKSYLPPQPRIVSKPHNAHSTFTELLNQTIAIRNKVELC